MIRKSKILLLIYRTLVFPLVFNIIYNSTFYEMTLTKITHTLCIKIKLNKLFIENKLLITLFYPSGYDPY